MLFIVIVLEYISTLSCLESGGPFVMNRAGARLFRALGEIVNFAPTYHKNMTHWKFFFNCQTEYFSNEKLSPFLSLVTTTLINFAPLFWSFLRPRLPCSLGDRLVGLMVAPGLVMKHPPIQTQTFFTLRTVSFTNVKQMSIEDKYAVFNICKHL